MVGQWHFLNDVQVFPCGRIVGLLDVKVLHDPEGSRDDTVWSPAPKPLPSLPSGRS